MSHPPGISLPFALPEKHALGSVPLRVLIVDDNVDTTDSLEMLLKTLGHDVRKTYDSSGTLDAALDFRPHVMLLDIGLPGLDGYRWRHEYASS